MSEQFPGCLLIVTVEVDPAVEAEWNRWYDTVHLPDALRCPGVRRGRRYVSTGDVSETIRGTKGAFTSALAGKDGLSRARIEGARGRRDPETPVIYKYDAADDKPYEQEALAFVNSVLGLGEGEDKYRNDTKFGVDSTFQAILGREAAYRRECITWDELWNSNKKLSFKPEPKAD
jgi:hypothetical protein